MTWIKVLTTKRVSETTLPVDAAAHAVVSGGLELIGLHSHTGKSSSTQTFYKVLRGSGASHEVVTVSFAGKRLLREVVEALLDSREFLAIQLAHEEGLVTDEDFAEVVRKHLAASQSQREPYALYQKVAFLADLIPQRLDADIVSVVCGCEIEVAEQAMSRVAKSFAAGSGEGIESLWLTPGPTK